MTGVDSARVLKDGEEAVLRAAQLRLQVQGVDGKVYASVQLRQIHGIEPVEVQKQYVWRVGEMKLLQRALRGLAPPADRHVQLFRDRL